MNKKKIITIASVVTALALAAGGTLAYLQDVSSEKVNEFEKSTISVELTETENGPYKIIPGESAAKNPTVVASTPDVDAYVFVKVTDATNNLVNYRIADGWTALPGNNGVYYREAAADDEDYSFPVLDGDKVSYSSLLTADDMGDLDVNAQLTFQSFIIQKSPFNDPAKAWSALNPTTAATAEELSAALAAGGTVVLTDDIVIEDQLVITGAAVLDMNGHTISNESDLWEKTPGSWSLVSVQGGDLLITGDGEFLAKENDCYAVDVRDGGNLTIENGKFVGNITDVYVYEGHADIKGGEFSLLQKANGADGDRYMVNLLDANGTAGTASASITGGSFDGFNPADNASEGAHTNYVPAGHSVTEANGIFTVE